jgi:hypothetical protein
MPGKELEGARSGNSRRRWRVRKLVLAVVLAALLMFLAAATASADWWVHNPGS